MSPCLYQKKPLVSSVALELTGWNVSIILVYLLATTYHGLSRPRLCISSIVNLSIHQRNASCSSVSLLIGKLFSLRYLTYWLIMYSLYCWPPGWRSCPTTNCCISCLIACFCLSVRGPANIAATMNVTITSTTRKLISFTASQRTSNHQSIYWSPGQQLLA